MEEELIQGMFLSIARKLDKVKEWNELFRLGYERKDFEQAKEEAERLAATYAWGKEGSLPLLDIVITPYREGPQETFLFLCDRIRETYSKLAEAIPFLDSRNGLGRIQLRIPEGIEHPVNCLRAEAVNLSAHWSPERGVSVRGVRGSDSAHAGVLAALAEDREYGSRLGDEGVPPPIIGGYEMLWEKIPGFSNTLVTAPVFSIEKGSEICSMWMRYPAPLLTLDVNYVYVRDDRWSVPTLMR